MLKTIEIHKGTLADEYGAELNLYRDGVTKYAPVSVLYNLYLPDGSVFLAGAQPYITDIGTYKARFLVGLNWPSGSYRLVWSIKDHTDSDPWFETQTLEVF